MTSPKPPRIIHGDCLEIMKMLPDNSVDSIVTDPPYGLGFMGKAWDALPPDREWAEECLRVLKPGGHLLAFGGTRTWHRLAVAVEDAGFEIRDSIAWMYGSGFPKSHNVGTSAGSVWEGWGTALKPAFEPVVMARKRLIGTVASNVLAHGTGALNIDSARVPTSDKLGGGAMAGSTSHSDGWDRPWKNDAAATAAHASRVRDHVTKAERAGRWPANVVLDEHMAAVLDGQSGLLKSGGGTKRGAGGSIGGIYETRLGPDGKDYAPDAGGASRFFKVAEADERGAISPHFPREFDAPFMYSAKAPKKERPVVDGVAHPTVKPLALMRWLVKLVTPPGGTVLEPFAGSGATVEACILEGFHCIAIEREAEYLPLIQARIDRQEVA